MLALAPSALRIPTASAAEALFAPIAGEPREVLVAAYLDGGQRVLGMRHVRSDARDRMPLPIRTIAGDALAFDAAAVLIAHNHPSGDPTPSAADRDATHRLARALAGVEVRLLDHLVLAAAGTTSFRALGYL